MTNNKDSDEYVVTSTGTPDPEIVVQFLSNVIANKFLQNPPLVEGDNSEDSEE